MIRIALRILHSSKMRGNRKALILPNFALVALRDAVLGGQKTQIAGKGHVKLLILRNFELKGVSPYKSAKLGPVPAWMFWPNSLFLLNRKVRSFARCRATGAVYPCFPAHGAEFG